MFVAVYNKNKTPKYLNDHLVLCDDHKTAALFPAVENAVRAIAELEKLGVASLFDFSIVESEKVADLFVPVRQWRKGE